MIPADDPEANPWTTVSSKTVYSNAWITVREDQVIRPDGQPGIYGVVTTRIATGVVALTEDGQVYLVGQYRYPTGMYSWEIPEGGTDPGEGPLECIQRELREEAGVVASEWVQLPGELHLSNCYTSEIGYVYLARDLREVAREPEGTEVLQVKTVPFDEALAMVDSGAITDSVTILGLLKAERYLRR